MYRTPTHEPRYKQGTRDRGSKGKARRYEERKESTEGSSSDEDEESTDRYTEESEDTTESQHGRGDYGWDAAANFDRDRIFHRVDRPDDILMRAYFANERVQKCDKVTQKNFLSPFPSFLIPPIYREVAGPPNYRFAAAASNPREDFMTNSAKPPRGSPKKMDGYEEDTNCTRCNRERRLCGKHKAQREMRCFSRSRRPERILACVQRESSMDPSSLLLKNPYDAEDFPKHSPKAEGGKSPKGVARENKADELLAACTDCMQTMENRKKGRRSSLGGVKQTESALKESSSGRKSPHGAPANSGPGKVREKLVYVVEEEGKDVTKLETDLFSVNEILTIKKDLLELSEFAKKLKKLKEMKRDAEKGKASTSACQCKPVAELLKNVNKRIEALEARQEELERGSRKASQKGDAETGSKKTNDPKTPSDSPPKTPVVRKQSAMTTVPSVPKTEMLVSRAGFSNNSEIVNELMDIKTQLQKLEKRRMSKELTPEAAPLGESKITKKKDHAIAVFSSRTYILTSENYEKTKNQLPVKAEVKANTSFPAAEKAKSKTDQTKENVANWLKSVSPIGEASENDIAMFLGGEEFEQEINQASCAHCVRVFNANGFENQEPQKNRASEAKPAKQLGGSSEVPAKNVIPTKPSNKEPTPHLTCKDCIMTPSGRLFVNKSGDQCPRNLPSGRKTASKGLPPSHPVVVRRSASSRSVSSPIHTKDRIGRLKKIFRESPRLVASHSKSTQELTGSSSGCKDQKTVRNLNVKNLTSPPPKEKIHKESKNELVKRRESNLMALKDFGRGDDPLSSSTFSELIRTVNLDSEKGSDSVDRQDENGGDNMHIYSLATMTKLNFKALESREKEDAIARERARERERERKRKEEEAAREAAKREEIQKPGYSKRNEQCLFRPEEPAEKEKIKKAEYDTYECTCCCKKPSNTRSSERLESGNETCSSGNSVVTSGREDRRRCERRPRPRHSGDRRQRRPRDGESARRRRERRRASSCKMKSRENARRRSKECMRKRKSKDCARKSKSKERPKKKKSKECSKPKKILSKSRISCSHNRLNCKCQAQPASSSHGTESLPSGCMHAKPSSESVEPTAPIQPKTKSLDSLEIYLKRQRAKPKIEKGKLEDESCRFRSIFKNLRRLYPKFSGLQLGNFSGDLSHKKPSQQQPQRKTAECLVGDTSEYEDDSYDYCGAALHRYSSHDLNHGHQQQHRHHQHHSSAAPNYYYGDPHQHHAPKQEHLNNCKCVRVYLQTQGRQDWPGVQPFRALSNESFNESTVSSESKPTLKSDFIFPGILTERQCFDQCCDPCESKKRRKDRLRERRNKKKCERRHRKKKNCCKAKCCAKKQVCEVKCVCDKCGNIHKQCRRKERVKYEDTATKPKPEEPCKCDKPVEIKEPCEPLRPPEPMHFPIFSFLRNICKNKPDPSKKTGSSIFKKISEVRNLKTCSSVKKKKSRRLAESSLSATNVSEISCPCAPKLTEIEDRLKTLEQTQADLQQSSMRQKCEYDDDEGNEFQCCEKKKKRSKKKKKKKKYCCDCCESPNTEILEAPKCEKKKKKNKKCCCDSSECPSTEYLEPPKTEIKKKCCCNSCESPNAEVLEAQKCEKKKRKKKKQKNKCCACSDSFSICPPQTQVQTYYCTHPTLDKTTETTETNNTNGSGTTKTTTTTPTTATTPTTDDTESSSPSKLNDNPSRTDRRLRDRLSSLQCFLANFQKHKKSKQPNNHTNIFVIRESNILDDCKGAPGPKSQLLHELKAQPSSFMEKIKKLRRKKTKKEDKKEKVKAPKEKRNPKSLPRPKRHRR